MACQRRQSTLEIIVCRAELHGLAKEAKLWERYTLAFYFTNTMFTTVGFGDVVPVNETERMMSVVRYIRDIYAIYTCIHTRCCACQ